MLKLTISITFLVHFFFLFDFHNQLKLLVWYLKSSDKHVKDKETHFNVECAREIVPIEFRRVVEEKIATKNEQR